MIRVGFQARLLHYYSSNGLFLHLVVPLCLFLKKTDASWFLHKFASMKARIAVEPWTVHEMVQVRETKERLQAFLNGQLKRKGILTRSSLDGQWKPKNW